jgi:hypothetical protein
VAQASVNWLRLKSSAKRFIGRSKKRFFWNPVAKKERKVKQSRNKNQKYSYLFEILGIASCKAKVVIGVCAWLANKHLKR